MIIHKARFDPANVPDCVHSSKKRTTVLIKSAIPILDRYPEFCDNSGERRGMMRVLIPARSGMVMIRERELHDGTYRQNIVLAGQSIS